MEIALECPCSCPGAEFTTMGDLLLHISREHPQRLSRVVRGKGDEAPDGDTEGAFEEVKEDEEGSLW
jgi:hypothetical protein